MKKITFLASTIAVLAACTFNSNAGNPSEEITFVGTMTGEEIGLDGSTVRLENRDSGDVLYAVISPANLGPNTRFDYNTLEAGYTIKVTGEPFKLGNRTQMAAQSAISYKPIKFSGLKATWSERRACKLAGGKLVKGGKLQYDFCLQKLPDAGQYCSDASQCFGECLMSSSADHANPGDKVDGICASDNKRWGCRPIVSNGKYKGTLCVD